MNDRLRALAQQRARLEARLAQAKEAEKVAVKRDGTRRKVIVGALVLRAVADDARAQQWLAGLLGRSLSERDRPLFGDLLPPPEA